MYAHPQSGSSATATSASQVLSAHRRALLDLLAGAAVITTAEYDVAVGRILACQDLAILQKWYRNTIREIARREEEAPTTPVVYATTQQREEIQRLANYHTITRAEKTKALLGINQLDHAQAKQVLAELWAKLLSRAEGGDSPRPFAVGPDGTLSYSTAA